VYLVFNWLPTLLGERGFALSVTSSGLAVHNMGGVLGALVGVRAIELFGSRRIMTAFALGAACIAAILCYAPIAPTGSPLVLTGLLAAHGFFLNAVQTTSFALTVHVYLADVRTTGSGAALAVGRGGGILSAFGGATLLAGDGRAFFGTLTAAMVGAAIGFVLVRRHIPPSNAAAWIGPGAHEQPSRPR
jgi:AAHS family 4-hydroxybenzoate transporter-like MFS transporter